jgi:class 3 adenylate cyclase
LFSDIYRYSKMTEGQLLNYVRWALPAFASQVIDKFREDLIELNTWGDGLLAVSYDPYRLAHLALDINDFVASYEWREHQLPEGLRARTSLHSGIVYIGDDPIRRIKGIAGSQALMFTAHVQPVTPPGHIYVTDAFHRLIDNTTDPGLMFDDVGDIPLAKSFDVARMFRLCRSQHKQPPDDGLPTSELGNG